jgi:hypothetical protein
MNVQLKSRQKLHLKLQLLNPLLERNTFKKKEPSWPRRELRLNHKLRKKVQQKAPAPNRSTHCLINLETSWSFYSLFFTPWLFKRYDKSQNSCVK